MTKLITIAFIPAVLGLIADAYYSRQQALEKAQISNREEVMMAVAAQEKQIKATQELLASIASIYSVAEVNRSKCNSNLEILTKETRQFTNIGILDEQGYIVCSAIKAPPEINFSNRWYFQHTRETGVFTASELLVGVLTQQKVIVYAHPILSQGGKFNGLVYATYKDTQFSSLPLSGKNNITARFAFFDRSGTFIIADPLDTLPLSRQLESQYIQAVQDSKSKIVSFDLTTNDGKEYFATLAEIHSKTGKVAYVRGVIEKDAVLAAWRESILWRIATTILALICGVALVWWYLEKWLVRDMLHIAEFARAAESGSLPRFPASAQTVETNNAIQSLIQLTHRLHEQREALHMMNARVNQTNIELENRVLQRTRELEHSEKLYRTLAEAIPQVVWSGTAKEGITYVNKQWDTCFARPAVEPLGHAWIDYFHVEDRQRAVDLWKECFKTSMPFTGQFRLRTVSGEYRHYLLSSVPLKGENETIGTWVGVGTDITELKKSEEMLMLANNELESFSYSVSHDLRAPLNAISGFSNLLLADFSDELDREAQHYLERIQSSSQHMSGLIDDLLKLAQLSVMESHPIDVDLTAISLDIIDSLKEIEPERELIVEVEPGMQLKADGRLMKIVMTNLIGNAWKFTRQTESPILEVGTEKVNDQIVYFISDNGAGFDMRYADKLFGVFQRFHSSKEFPGTGIGLATVKRIITRHSGTIWAKSKPNEGTTFYFTIGHGQINLA